MTMKKEQCDVVVIGAGPSGAVASAMLKQLGRKVVIIEKDKFPRFSIGESLLPQCMAFLEEAGIEQKVHDKADEYGFQFKNGAAFFKDGQYTSFDFTQKFSAGPGTTYQVKRADFDKVLADEAEACGVDIRYQQTVIDVDNSADMPVLTVRDNAGELYQIEGKYLLDASGFGRVLPRLFNLEKPSNFPVRQSYFSHFKDNIQSDNFDRNKILITVHPVHKDIWYWLIPFSNGTSSIGVVAEPHHFSSDMSNDQVLLDFIQQAPNLRELLSEAELINPVQSINGYSANVSSLWGKNYALLGNAGEFLDPVFSSGVTIALRSANLIAPLVNDYIEGKPVDFEQQYAQPLKQGVDCFRTFVEAWYSGDFQDVIFYDKQDNKVREMLSSILAGYAWDTNNPYVAQSKRRFQVLVDLCSEV